MNIKLTTKQITLGGLASAVMIGAGVISAGPVVWNTMGWITPNAYAEDQADQEVEHVEQQKALIELLEGIKTQNEAFERKWECDEISEDMLELRQEMARLGDRNNTLADAFLAAEQLHMQKAERWDEIECVEFVE